MRAGTWWSLPLETAQRVHALELGPRTALFCGRTQQVAELNDTAAVAWRALAEEGSCEAIAARLKERGASADESEEFAHSIVREWLRLGYVAPAYDRRRDLKFTMTAGVGPFAAEMRFFGTAEHHAAHEVFGHLSGHGAAHIVVDIVGLGDEDMILVDGASEGLMPRLRTVPRLKNLLTKRYCAAIDEGFLAHAALVSAGGKRVLLSGLPGAGKTTLTLALCAAGFAYGGDDIAHIGADARAEGAPFAAAVKSGAWPLLAPFYPALEQFSTHLREDGQLVRYFTPHAHNDLEPGPINAVFVLERRAAAAAALSPIEPSEALCVLLESGYAERGCADGRMLEALAHDLSRAVCARLTYSNLEDAVTIIQRRI